ncbi:MULTISPECIES: hypothetical protein [Anaerococcus]|uniref:Lipoprotein n=1 Tax=Anaerococcus cruorum TaxID=3115617 RepID=A0ABW9MV33_9FIRM
MKNKLLILSALLLLAACGNQSKDNTSNNNKEPLKREDIINPVPKLNRDTIEEELENYKNIKEEVLRDQLEEGVAVFKALDGTNIHSKFEDDPQMYTTIDFGKEGKFTGEYFATKEADGYDAGLHEVSGEAQLKEQHVSTYEGKFEYVEQLNQQTYKLRLKELNITSEAGVDSEIPQKVFVDFTKQLQVGDEFILYLDGAYIPLADRKGTALENQINPTTTPADKEVVVDHAFGPILYSPSEDVVWKTFVY